MKSSVPRAGSEPAQESGLLRGLVDSVVDLSYFSLFTTVASFFGAVFPAMLAHKIVSSHQSPTIVWTPLANGSIAGACLGVLCGALGTAAYKALHPACDLHVCVDRAFEFMQTALFWMALATGIFVGVLSISTFKGRLIYTWTHL